jgi:phosphate transport system substrate-binding protein
MKKAALISTFVLALGLAATAAAGGTAKLKGTITSDGSSTVGPWTTAAAEMYRKVQPNVRITVGISGTGGGFERFCRGEIDLSNASRPIKSSEYATCRQNGVKWVAFTVANDGISLVTSRDSTWVDCLTTAELKRIWNTGSKVDNWRDVRASFPDVPLKLFGAGTDSGTFDFFTEAINGKARASRSDYTASEDDNILVSGVSGTRGSLGYFGLSYYEENRSRLKLIKVDGGGGCVAPSIRTVQSKQYKPLSRGLYIYAKRDSFRRAEVRSFIGFAMNNQAKVAKSADFVPLTRAQAKRARYHYSTVLKQVR